MTPHNEPKRYPSIALWLMNHARACIYGFSELVHAPFASVMTIAVMGVAIALPAGFYLLLQNFQLLSKPWNGNPTISLYLQKTSSDVQIKQTLLQLKNRDDIRNVRYISPAEGLKEFKKNSPFADTVELSQNNPLPPVLVITPKTKLDSERLKKMVSDLKTLPIVDTAELDLAWIHRLGDIITLGKRIITTIAFLFGVGMVLIIGNTIRLTTQTHRQEMNILKLVGATNAFIRRPLLYRGFLYGCLGGCLAWMLVTLMLWWLQSPAQHLAESYGNSFAMSGLNAAAGLAIILTSALLGLIGSWVAVRRHLTSPETL